MMDIEIHSFDSLEARARIPFAENSLLISIGDTDAPPPKLLYKPVHMLRLIFDDITPAEIEERLEVSLSEFEDEEALAEFLIDNSTSLFDDAMADKIVKFVYQYHEAARVLICQCERGESRSAACAAAIAEALYGNGDRFFKDKRYGLSRFIYDKLLEAFTHI